jgi:F-type H+-transporting ATPase subunit delta
MTTARQTARDAKRLWRLCLVNGSPDEGRARQIVEQAIASGRSGGAAVLRNFLRLLKRDRDRRTALVESAAPLDREMRALVEDALARRYRRTMTTTFVVDPALIAGIRVTVDSEVYDGSVRGSLAAIEGVFHQW